MLKDDIIHRLLNIENDTRRLVKKYEPIINELEEKIDGVETIIDTVSAEGIEEVEKNDGVELIDILTRVEGKLLRILPNLDAFNDMIGNQCQQLKYALQELGFGGGDEG